MQNYEQILSELGIEVPDDKKSDLKKKMDENYRTKSDYDKAVEKREEYKKSLDSVQEKLKGFESVNIEDLKGQISTLTTQLNEEKNARAQDAQKVEIEKSINAFFGELDEDGNKRYEFLNEITENFYHSALAEELSKDNAKGKSIDDIFKGLITGDDGKQKSNIFVDRKQEQLEAGRAKLFTGPLTGVKTGAKVSPAELMRMKNENPNLDIKQYM